MADSLKYVHVCENAFFDENQKMSVIQIYEGINAYDLPALHPKMSIVTSIIGDSGDKSIEVSVISPSGKIVANLKKEGFLNKDRMLNFVANFIGVMFDETGPHKVIIKVNNAVLWDKEEIFVNKIF